MKTHILSDETGTRIARAIEALSGYQGLVWDEENEEYVTQSVCAMLNKRMDGLAYGVSVPKGAATACTKIGANAGIANPTPGVVGRPCIDPYVGRGPFQWYDVNATVDEDGTYHVKAVKGDGRYRGNGSNGDALVLTPTLYERVVDGESAVDFAISDTRLPGMSVQPQGLLPDGTLRPFMLYAKYIGVKGADGYMHSYSGLKPWNRNVSHNSLITQCRNATTGYSGKSIADDWYVKVMFLLKYATKHSQSVFAGCTSYDVQVQPTVAETGVTRVIVSNANADMLLVGSAVMLGTHTGNNDRNTASNYDVLDGARILRKEAYDASNTAIYLDATTSFDTATTYLLSTSPWFSGSLDDVEGDGTLTDAGRTSGREPFKIQGIECSVGIWEVLGDVIISSDGSAGWIPQICYDSRNESTSVTASYASSGKSLPCDATDAWKYPLYPESGGGLLFGTTAGASQSTGLGDGHYTNKTATTGTREWLGVGNLIYDGIAGLWAVSGYDALGSVFWSIGSRLSATGRGRAAA